MPLVMAFDEVKPDRVRRKGLPGNTDGTHIDLFQPTADNPDLPSICLNRYDPGRVSRAHFHTVDQFQIIVEGTGKFGRHDVAPYCVHFSRAYTPYGPLHADDKTGWAFMVLRTHADLEAHRTFDELKQMPNRQPWQITKKIDFVLSSTSVSMQDIPEINDDRGLYVRALTMASLSETTAPAPSKGDGQFVVVLRGEMIYNQREYKALAVAFIKPEEKAFQIRAGKEGLQGLILNLPQVKQRNSKADVT